MTTHSTATRIVAILGQGYVGLPVAVRAVEVGFDVVGFDIDAEPDGGPGAPASSYVEDIGDDRAAPPRSRTGPVPPDQPTRPTCAGFDVAVITVPTPLRDGIPDLSYIEHAAGSLAALPAPGALRGPRVDHLPGHHRGAGRARSSSEAPACAPAPTSSSATAPSASTRATRPGASSTRRRSCRGIDDASLAAVDGVLRRARRRRSSRVGAPRRPSSPSCSRTRSGTSTSRWSTSWRCSPTTSASTSGRRSTPPRPSRSGTCGSPPARASAATACRSTRATSPGGCERALGQHVPVRRAGQRRQRAHARLRRRRAAWCCSTVERRAVNGSRILLLGLAYKKNPATRESPSLAVVERLLRSAPTCGRATRTCRPSGGPTCPCRSWTARPRDRGRRPGAGARRPRRVGLARRHQGCPQGARHANRLRDTDAETL